MTKKQNCLLKLKKTKTAIRFEELVQLLHENGYTQKSVTGSHYIFGKAGRLPIMLVKPHGGNKHCHPMSVNKVIRMLNEGDA